MARNWWSGCARRWEPDCDIWYDSQGRPGPDGLWADGIAHGANWQDEIQRALQAADVFVVILSPAAMASPWVAEELGLAWSRKNINPNIEAGLVVVPILRETCESPLWLNLIQRIDFTGWRAEGWPEGQRAWDALNSAVRDTRTHASGRWSYLGRRSIWRCCRRWSASSGARRPSSR